MRKLSQFLVIAVAIVFSMTACVEEETSAVDVSGNATIKGIVFFNSDDTEPGNERVSGATVRVKYDASALSIASDGKARIVSIETTTDANGNYSFEVPTVPSGVTFSVEIDDYESTYKYNNGAEDVTLNAIYKRKSTTILGLTVGETRVENLTYTSMITYK